ncbi:MAG: HAD family hydrolase [Myxococcales bacterium]|nr:HAD family hydrolase [Myxococcales bacterium]
MGHRVTRPTVLLFDLDGTLVTTGGAGRRAIERALAACGVVDAAGFSFAGMTDRAIVRRALTLGGRVVTEPLIAEVLARYLPILQDEVSSAPSDRYMIHAGVLAALVCADSAPNTAVGLGTGNIEVGARIKLAQVGLSERFEFGGFGCDSEDRAELLAVGSARGAARLGCSLDACRVVVIGDTPLDIAAARAIGAESLAVATGSFSRDGLTPHAPTHLFDSLAAAGAIDAMLGSV